MENVKPTMEFNETSETYVIRVGELSIFLEYGNDKKFSWFYKEESGIHQDLIKITKDEKEY